MHDPAEATREMLAAATGPDAIAYSLNVGAWPSTPDKALLINQSGGRNPMPHLALNFPSVQVIVRGKASGYTEARDEIRKVCNVLLGINSVTANTDTYRSCNQMGDIISLGKDDNDRPMFSANFWFIVEPSDLGNRVAIS